MLFGTLILALVFLDKYFGTSCYICRYTCFLGLFILALVPWDIHIGTSCCVFRLRELNGPCKWCTCFLGLLFWHLRFETNILELIATSEMYFGTNCYVFHVFWNFATCDLYFGIDFEYWIWCMGFYGYYIECMEALIGYTLLLNDFHWVH